jgi:hypothetical protein
MKKFMVYVFAFFCFVQNTPRVRSLLRTYVYTGERRFAHCIVGLYTFLESIIDYGRTT